MLHIVGVPSTGLQSKKALLHHTLGDGRFDAFTNIYSNVSVTQAHIKPASKKFTTSDAGEEIDRAIFQALRANKPTYLTLPTDLVGTKIPAGPLSTPITHESITKILAEPKVVPEVEEAIIRQICDMYKAAQRPCVLVDAGVTRFKIRDETRELIEKTGMVRWSRCPTSPELSGPHSRHSSVRQWARPLSTRIMRSLGVSTSARSPFLLSRRHSKVRTLSCPSAV